MLGLGMEDIAVTFKTLSYMKPASVTIKDKKPKCIASMQWNYVDISW